MAWPERIGFGEPSAFFRGLRGGRWRYDALRSAYARCCQVAGVTPFTPHGLRRLYDSGLSRTLTLSSLTAGGYCVESAVGGETYRKNGPGSPIEAAACP